MSGKIILRLKTDVATGKFEAKVIGHADGATCSDGLDEALIRDILNAKIDGFGDLSEIEDSYKTSEYFEEKNGTSISNQEDDENEEEASKKKKDLSLGYGV